MATPPHAPASAASPPLQLGMVIFPGLTLLDLVGPQAALGFHAQTHLLWRTLDPVMSDGGIAIVPTTTFAACQTTFDILFVPGGLGTNAAMQDAEILAFLRAHARTARYVTSVCTGALVLAAAGLLDGYQAATHWSSYEALDALGVDGVRRRVVADRNRRTGGGVTAGIDFGLSLLAELRGETAAKVTQLMLEYDPQPPFIGGSPKTAEPEIVEAVVALLKGLGDGGLDAMIATAQKVRAERVR
jgi:cyclohexyl-isocyanide hydratase